jgi:DNA-directed RNA polymerase specialized sigma24 family protein
MGGGTVSVAEDEEFREFMRGRWPGLVRLGYSLTGDWSMAEDLAQSALAKAYSYWSKVRQAEDPDAYVRRILVNANHGRFRRRRVAEHSVEALPEVGVEDEVRNGRGALAAGRGLATVAAEAADRGDSAGTARTCPRVRWRPSSAVPSETSRARRRVRWLA